MTDQLHTQLEALESNTDEMIPAAQVKELITSLKNMFGNQLEGQEGAGADSEMLKDLGELAKFINEAKLELQDANDAGVTGKDLPEASTQLDAIIKMTEEATTRIMDECERVQSTHATMRDRLLSIDPPLDPDAMIGIDDALNDAETSVTRIYEACNFQDITGQRIMKVVKALQDIERMVLRMLVVFGLSHSQLDESSKKELEEDAQLLNGPALPGQGLEQDDIDDILRLLAN